MNNPLYDEKLKKLEEKVLDKRRSTSKSNRRSFRIALYLSQSETWIIKSVRDHFCRLFQGSSSEHLLGDWKTVIRPIETIELWAISTGLTPQDAMEYATELKRIIEYVSSWEEIMITLQPVSMVGTGLVDEKSCEDAWSEMFESLDLAMTIKKQSRDVKTTLYYSCEKNEEEDRISKVQSMVKNDDNGLFP